MDSMRRGIFISLLLVCFAPLITSQAATSYYTFALRGGYGSMDFGLKEGATKGSIAYGAELEYAYFFHPYIGIGIGGGFQRVGSTGVLNTSIMWNNVFDTDGEMYNHVVNLHNWSEKQRAFHVEVPITLQTQFDLNSSCGLLLKAGAAYSWLIQHKTNANGTIEHIGDYDRWHLQLDIPEYGFYTEQTFNPQFAFSNVHSCTFRFSADVYFYTRSNVELLCGLYAGLNIRNLTTEHSSIGFRNDRPEGAALHNFMNDYNTILNTNYVGDKLYAYTIQLQLGIRLHQHHHKSNHNCKCVK